MSDCDEIVMNSDSYCPNYGFVFKRPSYNENRINKFKNFYFYTFDGYTGGEYYFSISALGVEFGTYKHMSSYQKSQVRENA